MEKHSVNLIIRKEEESKTVKKLRLILPIAAVVFLSFFVITFLLSLIYINNNNKEFNSLQNEVASLEKKITDKKNVEGIYTLSILRIKTIDQLRQSSKNFANLVSEILNLQTSGVSISQTSIDKKNAVTVTLSASSSATLDEFITNILKAEASKIFSVIKSSGIVRDKTGAYLLTVSMTPDEKILQ